VTSPHAAVVHLAVQAVGGVIRGVHRADGFARRVIAMLAQHRHHSSAERTTVLSPFEVALDPHPTHLATTRYLLLADMRDVVLGIASRDASRAAGAPRQIDRHPPHGVLVGVVTAFPVLQHPFPKSLDRLDLTLGVALGLPLADRVVILLERLTLRRGRDRNRLGDVPAEL